MHSLFAHDLCIQEWYYTFWRSKGSLGVGCVVALLIMLLKPHASPVARSVYSRTQIVLLDDVLSAADVHTADTLVQQCLFGPLMTGRTVILVTHHISSVISGAALVVKMESGRIVGSESGREAVNLSVRAKSYPIYLEDQLQDSKTNDVLNLRPKNIDTNESLVEDEAKAECVATFNVAASLLKLFLGAQ